MDEGVVELVNYFNQRGLTTAMSCEGHDNLRMSIFWISFDKGIGKEQILAFMRRHVDSRGGFCCNGRFAERLGLGPKSDWSTWCYFAANKQAAQDDLKRWLEDEMV